MPVPHQVIEDLTVLLDYNWEDEEEDFEEHWEDHKDNPEAHIFTRMQRLSQWIARQPLPKRRN